MEKEIKKTEITAKMGKEPIIENVKNDLKIAKFSVAISEKDKETKWVNCIAWGKLGEDIAKIKPGTELNLTGVNKQQTWDKEGVENSKETLTVYSFEDTKQIKQGYLADNIKVEERGDLKVANFSLGIKGEEKPTFVKCTAWKDMAENLTDLKKGDELKVEGKMIKDSLVVNKVEIVSLKAERKPLTPQENVTGYLTSDIEIKKGPDKNYVEFSIGIKNAKEDATFLKCVAFEVAAEKMKDLKKGDEIQITGKIKPDKYSIDNLVVKTSELKSTKQNRMNENLLSAVDSGNIQKTKEYAKHGADIQIIKPESLAKHDKELSGLLSNAMTEGVNEKTASLKVNQEQGVKI